MESLLDPDGGDGYGMCAREALLEGCDHRLGSAHDVEEHIACRLRSRLECWHCWRAGQFDGYLAGGQAEAHAFGCFEEGGAERDAHCRVTLTVLVWSLQFGEEGARLFEPALHAGRVELRLEGHADEVGVCVAVADHRVGRIPEARLDVVISAPVVAGCDGA